MQPFKSIPSPEISYLDLGPLRIHFYALFIIVGIALAIWIGARRWVARGGKSTNVIDVALVSVVSGIIGARFFHVITHADFYFSAGKDVTAIFRIWEGGLAIFGGLIFGTLGAYLVCRSSGIRFLSMADALAPGILIAQAVGRLGNYFNRELFGLPTDLPWALEIPKNNPAYPANFPEGVTFHPTFLYEMLWNLVGFLVIIFVLEKRFDLRWGRTFASYLMFYSLGRAWIESIRIDPSDIYFGLRTNVWSAIFTGLIGLALFIWSRKTHHGSEPSVYISGYQRESRDELESEDSDKSDNEGRE